MEKRHDDTTLVLILSDNTHRVTSWRNEAVDFHKVRKVMKDQVQALVRQGQSHVVTWAFLAGGQQHQQWTAHEVLELAE